MEILFDWGLHRVEAGLLFIILYVLFIYIFILVAFLFYFFGFYAERLSFERCFHIYFSFCESIFLFTYLFGGAVGEFIFGAVACWWHTVVSTMKYSPPLQGCFLWESVFPVKTMFSLCFYLKWDSPWIFNTFLALFITHYVAVINFNFW